MFNGFCKEQSLRMFFLLAKLHQRNFAINCRCGFKSDNKREQQPKGYYSLLVQEMGLEPT